MQQTLWAFLGRNLEERRHSRTLVPHPETKLASLARPAMLQAATRADCMALICAPRLFDRQQLHFMHSSSSIETLYAPILAAAMDENTFSIEASVSR